jgi:hypothetical protein
MLSQLLFKFFGSSKAKRTIDSSKIQSRNDICSLYLAVDNDEQYFFEVKWGAEKIDKMPSCLSNLILGVTYGFFTEEIVKLISEYQSESVADELALQDTITLLEQRKEILADLLASKETEAPLVRPSKVFGQEPQ